MAYSMSCIQLQMCSELMAWYPCAVVKVQCQPDAFKHSVSHVHSVLCSTANGSGICCVAFKQAAVHQHPQALKLHSAAACLVLISLLYKA